MINMTMLWFLLVPVILAIVLFIRGVDWRMALAYVGVSIMITVAGFAMGVGVKTADVELLSGEVLQKIRKNGQYEQAYQCNCTTSRDSRGNSSTTCQTCYETHYTVNWYCKTTLGDITVKKLDKTTRRVWDTPDPAQYTSIRIGQPAAMEHQYVNYMKAVNESIMNKSKVNGMYAAKLPDYPRVTGLMDVNRVLVSDVTVPDITAMRDRVNEELKTLGRLKEVNLIFVIANTSDERYFDELQTKWMGGKKNDVVVVLGVINSPRIEFARVMSWTKSESFKSSVENAIMDVGVVGVDLVPLTTDVIRKSFVRREMKEFEYLKAEIDPSLGVMITILVLYILLAGGILWADSDGLLPKSLPKRSSRFNRF